MECAGCESKGSDKMLKSAWRAILIVGAMSVIDGMPSVEQGDVSTVIERLIVISMSIWLVAFAIHND